MKNRILILPLLLIAPMVFLSCEDDIFPELEEAAPVMIVDAFLDNQVGPQIIRIQESQPYYNAQVPPGVTGAQVSITDETGRVYTFNETLTAGEYAITPSTLGPVFPGIGLIYQLDIQVNGENYFAQSQMNRVPPIDSVTFRYEPEDGFIPESYFGQVFAVDPQGQGDTYWIKAWKNGELLTKPSEINIVFDAGFSAGGNVDGITFIQPVRDGVNPFDLDEDDNLIPPYLPGDQLYVEIHSITNETFFYLNELRTQTDRPGGFAELFAVPLSNIPTNIRNVDPNGTKALGQFNMAAVSFGSAFLDPNNLPQ